MRKTVKYFLIIILMIFTTFNRQNLIVYSADNFQFESVVTSPSTLTEDNLKWAEITVTITDDDVFKKPLDPGQIHIHNQPSGVSIKSVTRIDDHKEKISSWEREPCVIKSKSRDLLV